MRKTMELYVSPTGNDLAPGSKDAPLATLYRAKEKLAERTAGTAAVIHVTAGSFFMPQPLVLTEAESDTLWLSEGATLTGAMPIEQPKLYRYNDSIFYLELACDKNPDAFFINGQKQIMARYPNYNENEPLQGSTSMADIKKRSKRWAAPQNGFVRALHDRLWGGNSFIIIGKDENAPHGLSLQWVGDNNRGSGIWEKDHAMLVENIFEELDAPKEWYFDPSLGRLYFIPEKDTDLTNASFAVSVNDCLLKILGKEDLTPAKNIYINGFTFENTSRTLFTGKYIPLMRGDWCAVKSGCILLSDTEDVSVENCTLQNIGGNAIFLSGHNLNVRINNNEIIDIGSSGILLAGKPDSCREPSFWDVLPKPDTDEWYVHKTDITDEIPGPIREHYPANCLITDNHIQNIGIFEKQSSHIAISVAYKISITNNTLHTGPRAGININDGTFGGHEIAYNDVFDVQKETDDHGMFNSWGRDRFWSLDGFDTFGNSGAQKAKYAFLDAGDTTQIHHNRMHFASRLDGGSTFGIDLDDGSSNYSIHHNLCLNMGIKLREGFGRKVYNNIIVGASINLHCPYHSAGDVIERNIIISDTPYMLALADEKRFADSSNTIDRNCFAPVSMSPEFPDFWERMQYDSHSVICKPRFTDPDTNNYELRDLTVRTAIRFEDIMVPEYGKSDCLYQSPTVTLTASGINKTKNVSWKGAVISDIDPALMSSTGAGSLEGICLLKLPADAKANQFGLKEMDVIQTVNGTPVKDIEHFLSLIPKSVSALPISCNIIRNQKKINIQFYN